MIDNNLLGRYEYTEGNSYKFWTARLLRKDEYQAEWGSITARNTSTQDIDEKTALKRIKEKIKKGYVKVASKEDEKNKILYEQFYFNNIFAPELKNKEELEEIIEIPKKRLKV